MLQYKKIGIILPHLSNSQPAFFAINYINYLVEQGTDYDFILFVENMVSPISIPKCAIMPASECHGFDGVLIANGLNCARHLTKLHCPAKRFFYVWDLDWIRGPNKNFLDVVSVYRNPKINLIARNETHKVCIEQYCNKKVWATIEDCNLVEFIELFKRKESLGLELHS